MNELEAHEIATLFPTMSVEDLEHLRQSLGEHGQIEEILLFEGKILDGRHRYRTCMELGVDPRFREFSGTREEAFAYSVALNLSRRHLTTVQRAAAGAGIKEFQARLLAGDDDEVEAEPEGETEIDVSIEDDAEVASGEQDEAGDEDEAAAESRPKKRKGPSARTINAKARKIASQKVGVSGRAIDTATRIKEEAPDVFERMLTGKSDMSIPDARKLMALPREDREKVHALVDGGAKLKQAMKEIAPAPPAEEGAVFLGKVTLEPEQARAFNALVERLEIKRADAAREALLDYIAKHEGAPANADAAELVAIG